MPYILDLLILWLNAKIGSDEVDYAYNEIINNPVDDKLYDMVVDIVEGGNTTPEDVGDEIVRRCTRTGNYALFNYSKKLIKD